MRLVYCGVAKLIATLYLPFVVMLVNGSPNRFSSLWSFASPKVKATSALVNGCPSLHLTFLRSWMVIVLPAFDHL